jgi:hypothetical protein
MRKGRQIVHVISPAHLCWDYTERRWVVWPKIIGSKERLFHSAKRARAAFEMLRRKETFGGVRWLTYNRGRLTKNKTAGFCTSFVHQHREFNHLHLNDNGQWWILALSFFLILQNTWKLSFQVLESLHFLRIYVKILYYVRNIRGNKSRREAI